MRKHTRSAPLVVLLAALALVLGSLATASAAGLTKSQVRKIAAKVVAKKAAHLSVAHAATATTATDATKLGGKPPSAYQRSAIRFTLPGEAAQASRTYTFPGLTAGTYEVSFDGIFSMSAAGYVAACQIRPTLGDPAAVYTIGSSIGNTTGVFVSTCGGTGVLAVGNAAPIMIVSSPQGGTFTVYGGSFPSTVTFVRLDSIADGAPVP